MSTPATEGIGCNGSASKSVYDNAGDTEDFDEMPSLEPNEGSTDDENNEHDSEGIDTTVATNGNVTKEDQDVKAQVGMISDVKNLYESRSADWTTTWVDKIPANWEEPVENSETARYALIIRNKKSHDGRKKLRIDSIVVQSPLLKRALRDILKDYPGICTYIDRLTFDAPFKPFVHRWANLVTALQDEEDPAIKAHLDLFHLIMAEELEYDLKQRDDYIANGVITLRSCWMIFQPGTVILVGGGERAVRVVSGSESLDSFDLSCEIVDWDGTRFGVAQTSVSIFDFPGTKAITELEAYPLEYHANPAKKKKELMERGKAFARLSGYHYKHYSGVATGKGPWGPISYNVNSRIIIDTYAWNRFNPNSRVSLKPLDDTSRPTQTKPKPTYDDSLDSDDDGNESYDSYDEYYANEADNEHPDHITQRDTALPLTEDEILLCSTTVRGYSLKNKKWLTFFVASVSDIRFNDRAFERLVLPNDHKELLLALVESQMANKETFDDIIQGKGKGMIVLLSGPPGVGKTLTAESVSENIRAPLYMMSAGDLGLTSSDVESSLSNVLEMCTKWNAVLLIDEADVFLEQRSVNDLQRNKLVSIFLRMLEYYEGILFLTTNRVAHIDTAFQSRIHISMAYEDLSYSSRRRVWNDFIEAGQNWGLPEEDLDRLAVYEMNGREIKNVVKTAQLLARRKYQSLGVEHIMSVLAIEKRFI
ncbi:MAG: hypothetical protein Q9170_006975, partial [Blastenia crenularia]